MISRHVTKFSAGPYYSAGRGPVSARDSCHNDARGFSFFFSRKGDIGFLSVRFDFKRIIALAGQ